jgi:hypothetical protein
MNARRASACPVVDRGNSAVIGPHEFRDLRSKARFLPAKLPFSLRDSAVSACFGSGTRLARWTADDMHQEVAMDFAHEGEYLVYWNAIQRRACAVCLDVADDVTCGLPRGRTCALPAQLPAIVEAILHVKSERMDDYVAAIEAAVCARCPEQDEHGRCGLRDRAACALYTYLPLVVDAVEEAKSGRDSR